MKFITIPFLLSALALTGISLAAEKNQPNQELVGKDAPNFSLKSQDGTEVSLAQFRGKKNIVLVFNRAHW